MREYGSNINLPSLDNLFSSEQERQDAKLEKIQILPLTELHPFRNHPFQVRDDDEMDKMVDSIKEYGVMTPAIVRPRKDGGYEIVAGHRRCHASQRAGVETIETGSQTNAIGPTQIGKSTQQSALVYRVEDIAQMLSISLRAAYTLCNTTTDFRVLHIGTSIRVSKASFDAWLARIEEA